MKITYIEHSGFFIELEHTWLLFDYYKGQLPVIPEAKAGFVFASHRHGDHFNPEIFNLANDRENVFFVLSSDIWRKRVPEHLRERTVHLKPGTSFSPISSSVTASPNAIHIQTLRSTDEGVAFLVNAEGRMIYHAGDLNDWRWAEESDEWNKNMEAHFRKYIEPLRNAVIDAAFLPLDPRQEDNYALGLDYFLQLATAKYIYPMHFWGDPSIIDRWLLEHPDNPYRDRIVKIRQSGDTFTQAI